MQSKAKDVAAYLEDVPQDRRECLTRLRNLCLETLTGYEEGMEFGMPSYKREGVIEVAFASQKNHISLYVMKENVVNANRVLLAGASVGKGCIRYSKPEKVDFGVVEKLLSDTFEAREKAC